MPKILSDDEIPEGINSLDLKQREDFNVVHTCATCAKNNVKYDGDDVEPLYIFLSGSGGTGKSHLVKVIYNAITKTLFYHCKEPEKPRVLLLGPTKISTANKGGTIIHSILRIKRGT